MRVFLFARNDNQNMDGFSDQLKFLDGFWCVCQLLGRKRRFTWSDKGRMVTVCGVVVTVFGTVSPPLDTDKISRTVIS